MAPSGRIRKPTPKVISDNINDANSLLLGKKALPMAEA
jgi:hypothetical protein